MNFILVKIYIEDLSQWFFLHSFFFLIAAPASLLYRPHLYRPHLSITSVYFHWLYHKAFKFRLNYNTEVFQTANVMGRNNDSEFRYIGEICLMLYLEENWKAYNIELKFIVNVTIYMNIGFISWYYAKLINIVH